MPNVLERSPWWLVGVAAIFLGALLSHAWVEALGPSGLGLQYSVRQSEGAPPSFQIERVLPGSPLDQAGGRAGDVIERAGGHLIASQTDWFLARAHFETDRPIPFSIRRGPDALNLSVTLTQRNWETWNAGVAAFQIARPLVLFVALAVAFSRPRNTGVQLVGLLFAMVAVAEAFPPAGWATALGAWPLFLGVPVALASVLWLLIPVPWLVLALTLPRPAPISRWSWSVVLAPAVVFAPLLVVSTIAVLYEPASLAMPVSFHDLASTQTLQSVWGVIPTLFVNLWPLYNPANHATLLQLWAAVSLLWGLAGSAVIVLRARRAANQPERSSLRPLAVAVVAVWGIGIHNVFVRNWEYWFGQSPPLVFSTLGLAAEAAAFVFLAATLAYSVLKHRPTP